MVRSPLSRFAVMMFLIALVTLVAGILIRQLVPGFDSTGDAVWWVFEHIVVPEYVDDDGDIAKRAVATVLIVLGSILFAGAIIAILVQWWDSTMERLELGLTPVCTRRTHCPCGLDQSHAGHSAGDYDLSGAGGTLPA